MDGLNRNGNLAPQRALRPFGATALLLAIMFAAGCAPLLLGGAMVGGVAVATDRRSVGIQLEDEAIEARVSHAIAARYDKIERDVQRINITSYNRRVLLLGQAPSEAVRDEVGRIAERTENVRVVNNELTIGPAAPFTTGVNDAGISTRVRAALLNDKDMRSGVVAVTTERNVVYLLGRVTEAEGDLAAKVVARTQGVARVVKLFDYVTDQELADLHRSGDTAPRK